MITKTASAAMLALTTAIDTHRRAIKDAKEREEQYILEEESRKSNYTTICSTRCDRGRESSGEDNFAPRAPSTCPSPNRTALRSRRTGIGNA